MKDAITIDDPIIIRTCTPDDIEEIHAIEMASFDDPWSKASLWEECTAPSPPNLFMVAVHKDGPIFGYCICTEIVDELYVKKIAVAPTKKRLGVGRMLITFIVEYALKSTIIKISLDCDEKNLEAQAFYQAMGFERATPEALHLKKIVYVKELGKGGAYGQYQGWNKWFW